MISAYAGKEEEARCAALGVNVFLRKPITASTLFDAIVESHGLPVHTARRRLDAPLEREFDGVRALLAEDNEANQMVATELLGRLGIDLDVAGDGRAAVAMAQAAPGKYAAILMDMQMPELAASARRVCCARRLLRVGAIIAMTATAMKADLDACLAAGMNDYVTNPSTASCCRDAPPLAAGDPSYRLRRRRRRPDRLPSVEAARCSRVRRRWN